MDFAYAYLWPLFWGAVILACWFSASLVAGLLHRPSETPRPERRNVLRRWPEREWPERPRKETPR
jgi:hypothetical protein